MGGETPPFGELAKMFEEIISKCIEYVIHLFDNLFQLTLSNWSLTVVIKMLRFIHEIFQCGIQFRLQRGLVHGFTPFPGCNLKDNIPCLFQSFKKNERRSAMNNIRLLREQNDMSMEELALRVGVKHPAVYKWEHGRSNPSMENARKLADIFGVSLDYLMGRDSA